MTIEFGKNSFTGLVPVLPKCIKEENYFLFSIFWEKMISSKLL